MINVNDIKVNFDTLINAPQQGNYTPTMLNTFINNAVKSLYKERLGIPEQYEFGSGMPKVAYARTQKIHTDLLPFRKTKIVSIYNQQNFISKDLLPSDLYYETSVRYYITLKSTDAKGINAVSGCGCKKVSEEVKGKTVYYKYYGKFELVEEDKWSNRANSVIIKRTSMYLPFENGWRIFIPQEVSENVSYIEIDYLKRPNISKWAFIYDENNDTFEYNESESKHIEFDEMLISDIVARMVKEYSWYISDNNGVQLSEQRINTGQ